MRIFIVSRLLLAPVLIACQPIYRERNNPRPVLDHSQQPQATVWGNSMLTARAELPSCSPQTLSTHFRYQAVLSLQFCYNITQVTLRILKNMKKSFFGAGSLQPMICVPAWLELDICQICLGPRNAGQISTSPVKLVLRVSHLGPGLDHMAS